jgi:hypothetical protein
MSRVPPEPRRIELDGTEMVVLSPDAYERLDGMRRHVGAHANRVRALQRQLSVASAVIEELRQAAGQPGDAQDGDPAGNGVFRDRILKILAAHPDLGSLKRPGEG